MDVQIQQQLKLNENKTSLVKQLKEKRTEEKKNSAEWQHQIRTLRNFY